MRKRSIRLRHLVSVLAFLDRVALTASGVFDFLRQRIGHAIDQEQLTGVFNATAPNPVTNAELMRELRRVLHRPWSPPVPEFAARIGSQLMGTEASLALVSQRCVPKRFLEKNLEFEFPNLRQALANIYPNK